MKKMLFYILDENNNPKGTDDINVFTEWMNTNPAMKVANYEKDGVQVSTVFLRGVNHNMTGKGKPVLWETMIFGGKHDQYQERYTSYAEALAGHARAIKLIQK